MVAEMAVIEEWGLKKGGGGVSGIISEAQAQAGLYSTLHPH